MLVLLQWAWSYLSYERGARLITGGWHAGEAALPDPGGAVARTGSGAAES